MQTLVAPFAASVGCQLGLGSVWVPPVEWLTEMCANHFRATHKHTHTHTERQEIGANSRGGEFIELYTSKLKLKTRSKSKTELQLRLRVAFRRALANANANVAVAVGVGVAGVACAAAPKKKEKKRFSALKCATRDPRVLLLSLLVQSCRSAIKILWL